MNAIMDVDAIVATLVARGVAEPIAIHIANSMLTSTEREQNKKKKKNGNAAFFAGSNRKKAVIPLIHEDTCQTCGSSVSQKVLTLAHEDEADTVIKGVRAVCHNCPAFLESLSKKELVSLFMLQNSPDPELRKISNANMIKLAKTRPASAWLGYKITRFDMEQPEKS